jgi:hypothetical protein
MSERDTMHHLDLFDALSHIVPAAPAVVCDPGVRLDHDGVWCDPGVRLHEPAVWCDPGVRITAPMPASAPTPMPALAVAPPAPWLDEPAWELPRIQPDRRVVLPTIPTSLSFEERVTQRCLDLATRCGWDDDEAHELLAEILGEGSPDYAVVRAVDGYDAELCARLLHTAWAVRRGWLAEGPLSCPLTWAQSVLLVTCWHHEQPDPDEIISWLDDAFQSWQRVSPYSYSWGFHVELMEWLEAEGADALAYGEFPWDDGHRADRHTSEPRW